MRLFLVYYLSTPDPAEADVVAMEASLKAAGCNMSAVAFIKKCVPTPRTRSRQWFPANGRGYGTAHRFKSFAPNPASGGQRSAGGGAGGSGSSTADLLGGFGLKLLDNLKTALSADALPPVMTIVNALIENRSSAEVDDYVYLDPRSAKRGDQKPPAANARRPFQSAIVFVIGGGTYVEHIQLQQYARVRVQTAALPCRSLFARCHLLTSAPRAVRDTHRGSWCPRQSPTAPPTWSTRASCCGSWKSSESSICVYIRGRTGTGLGPTRGAGRRGRSEASLGYGPALCTEKKGPPQILYDETRAHLDLASSER